MANLNGFNANEVEPNTTFEPIPARFDGGNEREDERLSAYSFVDNEISF